MKSFESEKEMKQKTNFGPCQRFVTLKSSEGIASNLDLILKLRRI